ncbi:MAG: acetolactate synthase small subunit [Candidatus Peregrinibacteria bacterium]
MRVVFCQQKPSIKVNKTALFFSLFSPYYTGAFVSPFFVIPEKSAIIVTVENKTGVLNRIASLFRRRNFNIDSLTVARTENPHFSRMTIVLEDSRYTEQVTKQLHKLINVLKVSELKEHEMVLQEALFIKVYATRSNRSEALQFSESFHADIVDISSETVTFQLSSVPERIDAFIELLRPFGIKELVRSGSMAIARESKR